MMDIENHATTYYKNLLGSVPLLEVHLGDEVWLGG
jgi:hypothetical protein